MEMFHVFIPVTTNHVSLVSISDVAGVTKELNFLSLVDFYSFEFK